LSTHVRINEGIRSAELRVIDENGENLGQITREAALAKAREAGLDLIEISPNAKPPVAKIMDNGKFLYEEKKKQKASRAKSHQTELKSIQVKLATGEHDLALKAKKAGEWLIEGHRVKVELYLRGREKYMDEKFLKTRMERVLNLITVDYRIAIPSKRGPKGFIMIIEKSK